MIRSAFSDLFPINGFSHPTILLEFIRKVTRGLNTKCCFRQQSSITSLQKGRMISLHQSSVNTHKSIQSLNSSHLFFFYSKTFALWQQLNFSFAFSFAGGAKKLEEDLGKEWWEKTATLLKSLNISPTIAFPLLDFIKTPSRFWIKWTDMLRMPQRKVSLMRKLRRIDRILEKLSQGLLQSRAAE